jgi:hypothetical protein
MCVLRLDTINKFFLNSLIIINKKAFSNCYVFFQKDNAIKCATLCVSVHLFFKSKPFLLKNVSFTVYISYVAMIAPCKLTM